MSDDEKDDASEPTFQPMIEIKGHPPAKLSPEMAEMLKTVRAANRGWLQWIEANRPALTKTVIGAEKVLQVWSAENRQAIDAIARNYSGFLGDLRPIVDRFAQNLRPYQEILANLANQAQRSARGTALLKAGHLPHRTIPELSDSQIASPTLAAVLEAHYRDNWPAVRKSFEEALPDFLVDDDAKAAFQEALIAHEAGLYRASCRTLFPEIERVARIELNIPVEGQPIPNLRDAILELPLSVFGGISGHRMTVMKRFVKGFYSKVKTEAQVAAASADPIPNRHACVHGLVNYSTPINSINALIVTEFVFAMITELQMRKQSAAAGSSSP